MIEQRRIRFASIDGITREDIPLACEIWAGDIFQAHWVERPIMKLAVQFTRYICNPSPDGAVLHEIETNYQLTRADVARALQQMQTYGVVENYSVDDDVRVALHLTLTQRLRVLEARSRFDALIGRCPSAKLEPTVWVETATGALMAAE
jgi:hypothetical protein